MNNAVILERSAARRAGSAVVESFRKKGFADAALRGGGAVIGGALGTTAVTMGIRARRKHQRRRKLRKLLGRALGKAAKAGIGSAAAGVAGGYTYYRGRKKGTKQGYKMGALHGGIAGFTAGSGIKKLVDNARSNMRTKTTVKRAFGALRSAAFHSKVLKEAWKAQPEKTRRKVVGAITLGSLATGAVGGTGYAIGKRRGRKKRR